MLCRMCCGFNGPMGSFWPSTLTKRKILRLKLVMKNCWFISIYPLKTSEHVKCKIRFSPLERGWCVKFRALCCAADSRKKNHRWDTKCEQSERSMERDKNWCHICSEIHHCCEICSEQVSLDAEKLSFSGKAGQPSHSDGSDDDTFLDDHMPRLQEITTNSPWTFLLLGVVYCVVVRSQLWFFWRTYYVI